MRSRSRSKLHKNLTSFVANEFIFGCTNVTSLFQCTHVCITFFWIHFSQCCHSVGGWRLIDTESTLVLCSTNWATFGRFPRGPTSLDDIISWVFVMRCGVSLALVTMWLLKRSLFSRHSLRVPVISTVASLLRATAAGLLPERDCTGVSRRPSISIRSWQTVGGVAWTTEWMSAGTKRHIIVWCHWLGCVWFVATFLTIYEILFDKLINMNSSNLFNHYDTGSDLPFCKLSIYHLLLTSCPLSLFPLSPSLSHQRELCNSSLLCD